MSYDPSDDRTDADYYAEHPEEMDREQRYGADLVDAAADVIVNIFGERWEDDDEQTALDTLLKAYDADGSSARQVSAYANSDAPGYHFEWLDGLTRNALQEAGLIDPVDH